jgi:hypothetical protein
MTEEKTPEGASETVEDKVEEVKEKPETKTEDPEASETTEKTEDTTEEQPKKKGGFQKRINQLTRTVRELERAIENERMERQKPSEPEKGEPQLSDYDDWGKYAKDVAKWEVKNAKTEIETSQNREVNRVLRQKAEDTFKERMGAYSEKHEDFQELVEEIAPLIKGAALDALLETKDAPEIIHHLAKNPEEAERLSTLSPLAAAREIGRIEARLETRAVKKTTSAPPPPKTINGGKTVSNIPSDEDSDAEWMRKREAQLKASRGK